MQLPFSRAPRTSLVSCCPSARPAKRRGPAACGSWTVPGPPHPPVSPPPHPWDPGFPSAPPVLEAPLWRLPLTTSLQWVANLTNRGG